MINLKVTDLEDPCFHAIEFLNQRDRAACAGVNRKFNRLTAQTDSVEFLEAIHIPGIFQQFSESANPDLGEKKREWVIEKADHLLANTKSLLRAKEWKKAGFDSKENLKNLTPLQKVKMGELIADKQASILINFLTFMEPYIPPDAGSFLKKLPPVLSIQEIAKRLRQWMLENRQLLVIDEGLEINDDAVRRDYPKEIVFFPNIPPRVLGDALIKASSNNHLEVVKALIDSNRFAEIPITFIESALVRAVESGRFEVVKALIASNRFSEIHSAYIGAALTLAAEDGHVEVVKALIGSNRFAEIPRVEIENAFEKAAEKGNLELIKVFLACNRFSELSPSSFAYAIQIAGNQKVENILRNYLKVREEIFLDTITTSTEKRRCEIIKILLNFPRFSENSDRFESDFLDILLNYKFIKAALECNCFSEVEHIYVCSTFIDTIYDGYLRSVELFINHGVLDKVTDAQFLKCLEAARKQGHYEIVKLLMGCERYKKLSHCSRIAIDIPMAIYSRIWEPIQSTLFAKG